MHKTKNEIGELLTRELLESIKCNIHYFSIPQMLGALSNYIDISFVIVIH